MVNYKKAMIYKIVPKDNNDYCYIGSTCNFIKRKSQHKGACNKPNDKGYNTPLYKHIRDNGGWEEYEMVLVEYYPCETKLELHKRERECKIEHNDNLGCSIPCRTQKEYCKDNKAKLAKKDKEYREKNKEKQAKKDKEYYQANQEILIKKSKEYYEANKEKITEQRKEKKECPICKMYICKGNFPRHAKSKKHISNLSFFV